MPFFKFRKALETLTQKQEQVATKEALMNKLEAKVLKIAFQNGAVEGAATLRSRNHRDTANHEEEVVQKKSVFDFFASSRLREAKKSLALLHQTDAFMTARIEFLENFFLEDKQKSVDDNTDKLSCQETLLASDDDNEEPAWDDDQEDPLQCYDTHGSWSFPPDADVLEYDADRRQVVGLKEEGKLNGLYKITEKLTKAIKPAKKVAFCSYADVAFTYSNAEYERKPEPLIRGISEILDKLFEKEEEGDRNLGFLIKLYQSKLLFPDPELDPLSNA